MTQVTAVGPYTKVQVDNFTATGPGKVISNHGIPLKIFTLQVSSKSGTPTSWNVNLEGSLDGVKYTTIMSHVFPATNADGECVFSGGLISACLFVRANVTALTLGTSPSIVTTFQAGS
jgi:hypothetical protein